MKNISLNYNQTILYTLISIMFVILTCLACLVFLQEITKDILNIPIVSAGDGLFMATIEKNFIETGNIAENFRLGAPFEASWYDFPWGFTNYYDFFAVQFLANVFSLDTLISMNIYYMFMLPFIGLITFFTLRTLGVVNWISAGGAIAYACLLIYFSRGSCVLGGLHQFVPLSFLLCIWCYRQQIFYAENVELIIKNRRNLLAVLFCFLIANNGSGYWAIFSCFFLLITAFIAYLDKRRIMASVPSLVSLVIIAAFFMVNVFPFFVYRMEHGNNNEVGQRTIIETELYGLKIAPMLLPNELPGESKWEKNLKNYYETLPLISEHRTSYLGFIGSVGFIILLIWSFRFRLTEETEIIDLFARLNLAGILLALAGGVATPLTVIIGGGMVLRAYNRISVFLAFLAIGTVCWFLNQRWKKNVGRGKLIIVSGLTIFIIHMVILYSTAHVPICFGNLKEVHYSNKQFVEAIESNLPYGSMVYQMPYCSFPEMGSMHNMVDYQHFMGYLHSKALRWSYGVIRGREGDSWHKRVADLPVEERLQLLALVGFNGIYVDRRAYTLDEQKKLENVLEKQLGIKPLESIDGNLLFYSMLPYKENLLRNYTKEEQEVIRDQLLFPERIEKKKGIYGVEEDASGNKWQWLERTAEWVIVNPREPYHRDIKLVVSADTSQANLLITANGREFHYTVNSLGAEIILPMDFVEGDNYIKMETDAPKVFAPSDPRKMYMRIMGGSVDDCLSPMIVPEPKK